MSTSELYHVAIVVPDLAAAAAHLTGLLGTEWGPVVEGADADADVPMPNRMRYSTRAPYLELIEETPGTPWVCNEHSNLHHIGFWSTDLAGDSAALTTGRCPLEICGHAEGEAPVTFAYHRDPLGVRLELVDVAMRPPMEEFLMRPPPDPA